MKKQIKKWLFVLYYAMALLLLVVTPSIHLMGIWRMQLRSVELDFTRAGNIGVLAVWFAISMCDCIDRRLSSSEACMSFSKRRARRWRIRLVILALLFLITGVAYFIGQKYQLHVPFEYLGDLNISDLFPIWLIYILATFTAVRMP